MHSFPNACILLSINRATLWRWCRRCGIVPCVDPVDYRRRYLTDNQLVRLARLHHRVLVVNADDARFREIERLETRIAELERRARLSP